MTSVQSFTSQFTSRRTSKRSSSRRGRRQSPSLSWNETWPRPRSGRRCPSPGSISTRTRSWRSLHRPPDLTMFKEIIALKFFVGLCSGLRCICKILGMSNIWVRFSISPVHKLSRREEKNSWQSWDLNLWLLGEKRKRYLCAMQPH